MINRHYKLRYWYSLYFQPNYTEQQQQQQQQQQFIVLLWNYSINIFIGNTVCSWWERSHSEIAEANRAKWLSHAKFKLPVAYKLILIEMRPCSQSIKRTYNMIK